MDWHTHDFGEPINAFRDDLLGVLDSEIQQEIQQYLNSSGMGAFGSIIPVIIARILTRQELPIFLVPIVVGKPVLKLMIKHGLYVQQLIHDMAKIQDRTGWVRDYFELAEVRPEFFREVCHQFNEATFSVDEWLRMMRVFPASVFDIDDLTEEDALAVFERMPAGTRVWLSGSAGSAMKKLECRRYLALIVGVSDGYLCTNAGNARYFAIAAALPLELQEWLAHITQRFVYVSVARRMPVMTTIRLKDCDCRWML